MKKEVQIPPKFPYFTFMKLAHITWDLDFTLESVMHILSNGLGFKPSFGPIESSLVLRPMFHKENFNTKTYFPLLCIFKAPKPILFVQN